MLLSAPVRAVIFDFDGVLADTEPLHCAAFQRVAADLGVRLSAPQYYEDLLGLTDRDCLTRLCDTAGIRPTPARLDELLADKRRRYAALSTSARLYRGVPAVLEELGDRFLLAIASGALREEIESVLARDSVRGLFTAIVGAEDVQAGKPAPDPFLEALRRINDVATPGHVGSSLRPSDCVVIEDSPHGVTAARAAGMRCIAVTTHHDGHALGDVDAVVGRVTEIRRDALTAADSPEPRRARATGRAPDGTRGTGTSGGLPAATRGVDPASRTAPADPFSILIDVGTALCRTLHLRELLAAMMQQVREALDAEACSVMLVDEPSRTLRWEVALGEGASELHTLSVPIGKGVSGRVAATGEAIRIEDAQHDPRWEGHQYDKRTGFTTHSILCVPIESRGSTIGVIQVLNRRGGPFTDDDEHLLVALAGMGGVAIENARLYEHLEENVQERTVELTRTLAELREAQTQLVQSEKMAALGDLVAGVAHEINTPLGAIVSNIDLMARALDRVRGSLADPAQRDAALGYVTRVADTVAVSREAARRITGIVGSLRNFARLDETERKAVDLHEGIESTLLLAQHLFKNRITVRRHYGELPRVDCFPNQLNQVVLNILVNAAHAIDGAGEISVSTHTAPATETRPESVVIEIVDTGCGIPPEHLGRIFDPGFTTKGVGVGTGLGLAICYRIVAAHHGRIDVDSTPGRGTTVRITLPVKATE